MLFVFSIMIYTDIDKECPKNSNASVWTERSAVVSFVGALIMGALLIGGVAVTKKTTAKKA